MGVSAEAKTAGQTMLVRVVGLVTSMDTSDWDENDTLYMNSGGALASTRPSSGVVLEMGTVITDNPATGIIFVNVQIESDYVASASGEDIDIRLGDSVGGTCLVVENYTDGHVATICSDSEFNITTVYIDGQIPLTQADQIDLTANVTGELPDANVADDITASLYLPLAGGTTTGATTLGNGDDNINLNCGTGDCDMNADGFSWDLDSDADEAIDITRTYASTATSPIFGITQAHASDDEDNLKLVNVGLGVHLRIQNAVSGSSNAVRLVAGAADTDARTAVFYRNLALGSTNEEMVHIENANTGDDKELLVLTDARTGGGTGRAALRIDSDSETSAGLYITSDVSGGGSAAYDDYAASIISEGLGGGLTVQRDVSGSTKQLVYIYDNHIDSTGIAMYVKSDSDASAAFPAVKIQTTSAAHDESVLWVEQAGTGRGVTITRNVGGATSSLLYLKEDHADATGKILDIISDQDASASAPVVSIETTNAAFDQNVLTITQDGSALSSAGIQVIKPLTTDNSNIAVYGSGAAFVNFVIKGLLTGGDATRTGFEIGDGTNTNSYFWIDDTGDMRQKIGAAPSTGDTDGTIIGAVSFSGTHLYKISSDLNVNENLGKAVVLNSKNEIELSTESNQTNVVGILFKILPDYRGVDSLGNEIGWTRTNAEPFMWEKLDNEGKVIERRNTTEKHDIETYLESLNPDDIEVCEICEIDVMNETQTYECNCEMMTDEEYAREAKEDWNLLNKDTGGWINITNPNLKLEYAYVLSLGDNRQEGIRGFCIVDENGDISRGDLLVTSSTEGCLMKQHDDIIRSMTVGKSFENVVFESGKANGVYGYLYAG